MKSLCIPILSTTLVLLPSSASATAMDPTELSLSLIADIRGILIAKAA